MTVKIKKAKRKAPRKLVPAPDLVLRLADLEAENQDDIRIRDEADARITARRRLIEAARVLNQLSPKRSPSRRATAPKPAPKAAPRPNGEEKPAQTALPLLPQPASPKKGTGAFAIVLDILRDNPDGLTAGDVKRKARDIPAAPVSLT